MVNNVVSEISNNVPIYLCENVTCRLCGCMGNNSFILLKESCYLVKVIRKETGVKLRDNDVLPKTVCRGCIDKINMIQHFKSHCRKTQKVLEQMYFDQSTGKIDLLNVQSTQSEDDSEMVVEWLDDEFSNEIVENNLLKNNNNKGKYGVMYKDTNIFKSVHVTLQEQDLPENATVVPYKILGHATKHRVQTYSKEELLKLSTNTKVETQNSQETIKEDEIWQEPILEDNTYVKLNDLERQGPLLYRLLTSGNKTCENEVSSPSFVFTDGNIETNENNNIIVPKQFPTDDNFPNKRIDRSGRIFVTNSHKYVQKVSEKEYICMICEMKFRYPFQVELHVRKHTGELPFICKICGKSFITGFYLLKHEKIHSIGQFTCEVCGKNFRIFHALKDHQRIHTDLTPSFKCESCGKEFFTKGYFNQHKLIHAKKKHICEICGKQFSLHATMKRHQNRHKNIKFQCDLCPKLLKTEEEHTQHRKKHEKNGSFRCDCCSLSFSSKKGLQMHKTTKHKNEINLETNTAVDNLIMENIEFIYSDQIL